MKTNLPYQYDARLHAGEVEMHNPASEISMNDTTTPPASALPDTKVQSAFDAAEANQIDKRATPLHPLLRDARAVVFDAGGTLTHPDWQRFARAARELSERDLTQSDVQHALATALYEADATLRAGLQLPPEASLPGWVFRRMYGVLGFATREAGELHRRLMTEHDARHLWCGVDADAPTVITELKAAGLAVGVISNTEDGRLVELLELIDLAAHFDFLIDSHVVGLRKPDAAIFRLALERLNLRASEVVYVGDSYGHDVLAARAAGMRAVLVDPLDLYRDVESSRIKRLGELVGC